MKAIRAELAEIDAAERVLDGESAAPRRERGSPGSGKKTLKELAIDILWDHPEGLEASAILGVMAGKLGLVVRRESLSPQLSRLGQEGFLEREGLLWKIAADLRRQEEAQKDETPDGYQPSGASSAVDSSEEEGC